MSEKVSKESQCSFAPPSIRLGGGWGCDKLVSEPRFRHFGRVLD